MFNDRERYVAIERVRENNSGVTNHHIKWSHIAEALMDPVTWLYTTIIFAGVTPNGIFGTFGSLIIKSLGFNNLQALGIQVPSGFIGFLSIIIPTYIIRKTNNYRFHMLTLFEILTMIGGIIMWASPRSNTPALLVGYCTAPKSINLDLMSCFAGIFCMTLLAGGTRIMTLLTQVPTPPAIPKNQQSARWFCSVIVSEISWRRLSSRQTKHLPTKVDSRASPYARFTRALRRKSPGSS
jgi:hypothetical protein